jgi:hypothetical protein
MTTHAGRAVQVLGGPDPGIPRGGSTAFGICSATRAGTWDGLGPTAQGVRLDVAVRPVVGRHDGLGPLVPTRVLAVMMGAVGSTWAGRGPVVVGRFIPLSAVYRNADRLTLAGLATDLAGQPLRVVNLQFIGETVQQHFFGGVTDANGLYVAFLDVGDTYTAFAYNTAGTVWKLDHRDAGANSTGLVFRQVTRRGGFGEGLFLQGAS